MAYVLRALIARNGALRPHIQSYPAAHVVRLRQELEMLPLTAQLLNDFQGSETQATLEGLLGLTVEIVRLAEVSSANAPVAYVEAEYFGGGGSQGALVWEGGKPAYGPFCLDNEDPARTNLPLLDLPEPTPSNRPINRALRFLGATRLRGFDEFADVGLQQYRFTDEWVERAP